MSFIDLLDEGHPAPKRGDIVQSNPGAKKERTWLVLRARRMRRAKGVPRYQVWMVRWWQLEPDFRNRLYASAQRNGGQTVHFFWRYPRKKRRSFEDLLLRKNVITL